MALTRTAKSCGSDAPIVGVKSARRSAGDGVKKRGHRGEREVSRKTIARGKPGRSGVTVVTNSYACFYFACEAAGALRARHSLRPLFSLGGWFLQTSGVSRRENAESCFGNWGNVIAGSESDANRHCDPLARNDGLRSDTARNVGLNIPRCLAHCLTVIAREVGDPVFQRRL